MREPMKVAVLAGRAVLRLKSWLPQQTNDTVPVTLPAAARALGMAPGEWLIMSSETLASNLRESLTAEAARQDCTLVDLSDGLVVIEVYGSAARELLSKGCGLDLHPRVFTAGQWARCRFAQVPVVIECLEGPPRFELTVARSFLQYLHAWLIDAVAEFANVS